MKRIDLLLLVLLLLLISCKESKRANFQRVIEIKTERSSRLKLSQFVDSVIVIPLETNASALIGQIGKIQFFKDRLYIQDDLANSILVFDKRGRFVERLSRIGLGPGEYIRLKDFEVHDSGLYVLDISGRKINHYDKNMNYMDKTDVGSVVSYFTIKDDGFWLYKEPDMSAGYYQLTKTDKLGNVVAEEFYKKKSVDSRDYNWVSGHVFQKVGEELYYSSPHSNSIYCEKENKWSHAYFLSFGNKGFPENEDINDYDITADDFPFIIRKNFYCSNRYLLTDFFVKDKRHFTFLDKLSNEIFTGIMENDLIPRYGRFFPLYATEGYLIEVVNAEYVLSDFQGLIGFNDKLNDLQEDDNPVLVLYALKK